MHIPTVCRKKKSHEKFSPASLLNQHSDPPPSLVFFFFFQNFVADEINILALGVPENKFPAKLIVENK